MTYTKRTVAARVAFVALSGCLLGLGQTVNTQPQLPSLRDVLSLAGAYADEYENRFSILVAEEHYEQVSSWGGASTGGGSLSQSNPGGGALQSGGGERRRVMRSDYLLVRLEGGGWMPFRDVFEVDGQEVRGRADRVLDLFLHPTASSIDRAARIMADSTRYNLGGVQRTINIPTLAVLLAQPDLAPRFSFEREGEEPVAGRHAWLVSFREVKRPTLTKTSRGRDLPLTGVLWIDPAHGTILKTSITAADPAVRASVTVTFREEPELDLWVPALMEERYSTPRAGDVTTCRATYSHYRRFTVTTSEQVKKPPPS